MEVRIEFVVRSKAGSMMDLSMKSKESSLSLRNLKDKSFNIKHSLGDKFKILNPKSRKSSKFAGENQVNFPHVSPPTPSLFLSLPKLIEIK